MSAKPSAWSGSQRRGAGRHHLQIRRQRFSTTARCSACSCCRASWSSLCRAVPIHQDRRQDKSSCIARQIVPASVVIVAGGVVRPASALPSTRRIWRDGVFQACLIRPSCCATNSNRAGLCPVLQTTSTRRPTTPMSTVHQLLGEGLLPECSAHRPGAGRRGAARRRFRLLEHPNHGGSSDAGLQSAMRMSACGFSRTEAAAAAAANPGAAGNARRAATPFSPVAVADRRAHVRPVKGVDVSHHNRTIRGTI